jgi:hypothetical protein
MLLRYRVSIVNRHQLPSSPKSLRTSLIHQQEGPRMTLCRLISWQHFLEMMQASPIHFYDRPSPVQTQLQTTKKKSSSIFPVIKRTWEKLIPCLSFGHIIFRIPCILHLVPTRSQHSLRLSWLAWLWPPTLRWQNQEDPASPEPQKHNGQWRTHTHTHTHPLTTSDRAWSPQEWQPTYLLFSFLKYYC